MRSLADDATEVYRSGFSRVERIGDIVLQELAGAPAGNIQEAVVARVSRVSIVVSYVAPFIRDKENGGEEIRVFQVQ